MAPKADGLRRMSTKKTDPRKPPVEGSALQRKETCVAALMTRGDRPVAAYNELAARDVDGLQNLYK